MHELDEDKLHKILESTVQMKKYFDQNITLQQILNWLTINYPELGVTMDDLIIIKYWYDYNKTQLPINQVDYMPIFDLIIQKV